MVSLKTQSRTTEIFYHRNDKNAKIMTQASHFLDLKTYDGKVSLII